MPSYKRIALSILKNDHALILLGFTPPKSEVYNTLKRTELEQREIKRRIQAEGNADNKTDSAGH